MGFLMKIFGFEITKDKSVLEAPVAPTSNNSATEVKVPENSRSGTINPQVQILSDFGQNGDSLDENELITKYREISILPEVDMAIQEIAGEFVSIEGSEHPVKLDLDKIELSDSIKEVIIEEFNNILRLLNFSKFGYDIFKRWYIDGKIYYYCVTDSNTKKGIQELRLIDPRQIRKIRELVVNDSSSAEVIKKINEYYIYSNTSYIPKNLTTIDDKIKSISTIQNDAIAYSGSGVFDNSDKVVLSHLYKAIKPANNKRMMEDAMMIYRLARSSEKLIFYVDTGTLSNVKGQQYIQELANKHKVKVAFDPKTGDVKNDRNYLAITENYWLPRQGGSTATSVEQLAGGQNLGETGESEYFKSELLNSLNVPLSRFSEQQSIFSDGTEITRDEVRFNRFINILRSRFNVLFEELLLKQLALKNIMSKEDFDKIKNDICYIYQKDNVFSETLNLQKINAKLSAAESALELVGTLLSINYVYKKVLNFTDEEIAEIQKDLAKEKNTEQYALIKQTTLGVQDDQGMQDQQQMQQDVPQPQQQYAPENDAEQIGNFGYGNV